MSGQSVTVFTLKCLSFIRTLRLYTGKYASCTPATKAIGIPMHKLLRSIDHRCTSLLDSARARASVLQGIVALGAVCLSGAANAQATTLGTNILSAACQAAHSPLIAFVFVIAILGCVVALVVEEGKGIGGRVVKIATGAAVVVGIGTALTMLGLTYTGGCS